MLRFLSKIRYRLASENKLTGYICYALGEIVLVVIGILIALKVNNLNENRKLSITEHKALTNLQQDFLYNQNHLTQLIARLDTIMEACLTVLAHTGKRYNSNSGFAIDSILGMLATVAPFFPKNGFLDDLLNSGNLGIFKNDSLRQMLSSWKPSLEYLKERENDLNIKSTQIEDFISENGSWVNYDHNNDNLDFTMPESGSDIDNNRLLLLPEFENYVDNQIFYINVQKERQVKSLRSTNEILKSIENGLNK